MSNRPLNKSLIEQQETFKKALLSQSKVLENIAEVRALNSNPKSHAYDHLTPIGIEGKIHINTEIYRLIHFLKEKDSPVSIDDIKRHINLDIAARPDLLRQVSTNDRIICNLPFLEYKPQYNIRTKDELLNHLKKSSLFYGFDVNSIREVFPKVNLAIQELSTAKSILGLGPKEDNFNILFYNDMVLSLYPDSDVKQLWHGQIIPDEFDLQSRLQNAGLKGLEVIPEKPRQNLSNKRPSNNRYRRVKMTNTHLSDFDFSKEYSEMLRNIQLTHEKE